MMNGKSGLIADFVATFNSVRLSPQGHYVRSRLYFDILRFPVRYSAVLFRFMLFRVNGYHHRAAYPTQLRCYVSFTSR